MKVSRIQELINRLEEILNRGGGDPEVDHSDADDALLAYINDERVNKIWNQINKWYA